MAERLALVGDKGPRIHYLRTLEDSRAIIKASAAVQRFVARSERLGVKGFVRNLPDGEVEVHAEADAETLARFKLELERGPRMAQVTEVGESDVPASGVYSSFLIRG